MKTIKIINKIKPVIAFVVFIGVVLYLFIFLSYLFRQNPYGYEDRISVAGFPEEPKDSIDVVYIGGSAAFVYWEPYLAYRDCGFTSYDLATNTIQAESILAYLEYASKYQNPDLYIIGLRSFQYYSEEGNEIGLRLTSDSLDEGLIKIKLINNYLNNRNLDVDKLALYFNLIKYHTNYAALGNQLAWEMSDNRMSCPYKGCQIMAPWAPLETPVDFYTEERAELLPGSKETLEKILDYCDQNNLNVLFVVCPYRITSEHYAIYNSLGDLITTRGYGYLNTNDYLDDMKIDYSMDFYNDDHVNALGAEKYTIFLEQYITENYDLPDHRGESGFENWDAAQALFMEEAELKKQAVLLNMQ